MARGSRYWGPTRANNGAPRIIEDGFGPDFDNAKVLNFISRHKAKPFFLYYSMVLVHDPWVRTPDSMTADSAKSKFSGMVSYMDRQVGAVMAQHRAEDLDKNTIVIVTSNNGTSRQITSMRNGYAVRGEKGLPTVTGTQVPFISWGPGVPNGRTSEVLTDLANLLPTFAEFAGKPALSGKIDGVSMWPVIEGKAQSVRSSIFMHYAPMWQFEPVRFAFDAKWQLYGDGRFMAMDPTLGTETEVRTAGRTGEAARHYRALRKVLDSTNDGPLDPTRYPWWVGQDLLDPAKPSTVAGCSHFPGGEG